MKILFLMSSVPDTTSKINFTENDTKFDEDGIQFVINPHDEFGLTKAMQLKEKLGGELVVLNVGTAKTEPVIRKTLAIGADRAIRIDVEPTDSYFTASQIAQYIKQNNDFDLIIAGKESLDYNSGIVHGLVAEMTGIKFVNACIGLDVIENNVIEIAREIEGGKEIIDTTMPIIIGGQKGLVKEEELRIPNMRGIMMARKKPLEVLPAFEAEVKSKIEKFEKPPSKGAIKLVEKDNLDALINLLHNEAKVI